MSFANATARQQQFAVGMQTRKNVTLYSPQNLPKDTLPNTTKNQQAP